VIRRAGSPLLAGAEVFDVYRDPERLGAGKVSVAVRLAYRVGDRTLTDAEVARQRSSSSTRSHRSSRGRSVPANDTRSVAVFGAAGYAGSLAARLLHSHPNFELGAITARGDVGRRLDDVYPYHRVPLVLEEVDIDRHGDVDAAIVAYPHGASAPFVAQLRERGVKVVDLSADFRLRDVGTYEEWYKPHPEPGLIADAAYGLPELYREQIPGRS